MGLIICIIKLDKQLEMWLQAHHNTNGECCVNPISFKINWIHVNLISNNNVITLYLDFVLGRTTAICCLSFRKWGLDQDKTHTQGWNFCHLNY